MADKKQEIKQAAAEDGGLAIGAFSAAYLVFVPITSFLARTSALSTVVDGTARFIPGLAAGRTIPALSTLYVFVSDATQEFQQFLWTFGASGALSAAGQAMAREEGLDDFEPRKYLHNLEGLPLRLRSAHYGLLENFAPFALAAALAQFLAPNDREIVNLLGYHVLAKVFLYYPSYIFNIAPLRTMMHVSSIGALINVLWRLAAGA